MTNSKNRVAVETIGARVTNAKQLTVGRWYALGVGQDGVVLHAKYLGKRGRNGKHRFETLREDRTPGYYCEYIERTDAEIAEGHRGGAYKFRTHPDKLTVETFPAGTTAQRIGAKVGDKFVVGAGSTHTWFREGDIVELAEDDKSCCPYFRKAEDKFSRSCYWSRLKPLPATESATDSNGFILNDGKRPVDLGTRVDVIYRDGAINYGVRAGVMLDSSGSMSNRSAHLWNFANVASDIISWRLHKSEAAKPTAKAKPVYPKALPDRTRARDIGAVVGDRFMVVSEPRSDAPLGTIVELQHDDGSSCPFFLRVKDGVTTKDRLCLRFSRLAQLPKAGEPAEPTPLHPVDSLKADIAQLVKEADAERAKSEQALTAAAALDKLAEAKRQQLADSLRGFLPGPKPSIW